MMLMKDPYQVLSIVKSSTLDKIKAAYKNLPANTILI